MILYLLNCHGCFSIVKPTVSSYCLSFIVWGLGFRVWGLRFGTYLEGWATIRVRSKGTLRVAYEVLAGFSD